MTSDVTLSGSYSYDISPLSDTVTLDVTTIENNSPTVTTGTIRLELWLTTTPWNTNAPNSGWEIATDRITGSSNGTLPPNTEFNNLSATVTYADHPPAGTYYVTLAVAEYTGTNPSVDDGYSIYSSGGFPDYLVVGSNGSVSQGSAVQTLLPTATFVLTHDNQVSVTEGETEKFTLNTSGVPAGTYLYYSLTGVAASDVVGGNLTGSIQVGSNGVTIIPVTLTSAPGEGLSGSLIESISAYSGGPVVASASVPLSETPVQTGPASGGVHPAFGSVIAQSGQTLSLTSLFSVQAGATAPQYLDVTFLDRNEYPGVDFNSPTNYSDIDNNNRTGHFTINGTEFSNKPITAGGFLSGTNTDAYEESIAFSYIPSQGKYYNSQYGYLDQLSFISSSNNYENTYISVYGSNNPALLSNVSPININAPSYTVNTVPLSTIFSELDGYQYCGTVDVITRSDIYSASTIQATPNGVCAAAQTFVGKIWSDEGCWTLASNISAVSGASLNPATAYVPSAGGPIVPAGNGEWLLVYFGANQSNPTIASAEAIVRPGDIITTGWSAGGGHITTVVSGYGSQAQVIDNEEIIGNSNNIINSANDGVSSDITIQPAHSLDSMLNGDGATPSTIAVYRLDTPTITVNATTTTALVNQSLPLASLFSAEDAGGAGSRAITEYALYSVSSGSVGSDSFLVNAVSETANSAATAILVSSSELASLSLKTSGTVGAVDTIYVSAYNGAYWGDYAAFTVDTASSLTASAAVSSYTNGLLSNGVSIDDTGTNVASNLDALQPLAAAGKLSSISLTDSGTPSLSISAEQLTADATVLNDISGPYSLTVSVGSSAAAIAGLTGHATTVHFTGNASQYTIGTANGAVTVTSDGIIDTLSNIAGIQFMDVGEIVAAPPGPASGVTTGNVTELYAAVLAREPDLPGLTFYQTYLQNNPTTPLQQFAEFFLSSEEYKAAHNYAQSSAGDTQFITDSYQNLLHRTPSAAEVSFYETNVLAPAGANLTPGTAAYANAQLQAHALMLVYFSASAEFLSDVQVTAMNPPSAQHWLILN